MRKDLGIGDEVSWDEFGYLCFGIITSRGRTTNVRPMDDRCYEICFNEEREKNLNRTGSKNYRAVMENAIPVLKNK